MKLLFSICLLITTQLSFAQIKSVVVGDEYTNNRNNAFNGFIGETNLAVFGVDYGYVSKKKQELIIRKFNKNDLTLIKSVDVYSNPIENYINTPLELYFIEKNFYLFSQFTTTKSDKAKIGLFIYDENCTEIDFMIVDSVEQMVKTEIEIKMAQDSSGFVVMQSHIHKVANRQVVELSFVGTNGTVEWQKELLSTNSINNIEVEEIIITKKEVFLLCNYGYSSKYSTSLTNKYTLWVYRHDLNFMKEIVLRLKHKWINGVKINLVNNELLVAGYVNDSKNFGINATFNFKLNEKYEPQKVNYSKFSDAVLLKFNLKNKKLKTKYLKDFYLRHVLVQKDGSFYTIGEEYFTFVDRVYDPRTNVTSTTNHYSYNSVLISYFDTNGVFKWHERIYKNQNSIEDNGFYSSFTAVSINDNSIALIYNDNEKNLELNVFDYQNHKELFNNRRHAIVYVTVDNKGVFKRKRMVNKTNFSLYAKQSTALLDGKVYLKMEYGRHSKIISADF